MTITFRLTQISPELVERLLDAPETTRRAAVIQACTLAAERTGLDDERALEALQRLRAADLPDNPQLPVQDLAQELDEKAWDIQEKVDKGQADEAEYLRCFAKARAAAALELGTRSGEEAAMEALYESYHAMNDREAFMRVVIQLLNGNG